ncbi:hypothetical protein HXA34_20380 [Salipaludibacillus agaradhaerens]|jgi:hypothetical protein|uniref:hypothetical protein n=1 Tax=Salipaludibacillus agaradhaerens TaxID=76935 RepID=UPI00215112AE|nr:hypothetical protein [Salipaludibacillus agaradhaerens]MCR6108655.1 hypothetical protein [Salipaludibacillus agaradhaerens]MCR6120679.1 hypothetical protein [Salipaludibacillus agaradhaerens]
MIVRELASKFMANDPKQACKVQTEKACRVIYEGRIEFLFNCNNPIEEHEVTGLQFGEMDDNDQWNQDILIITVTEV